MCVFVCLCLCLCVCLRLCLCVCLGLCARACLRLRLRFCVHLGVRLGVPCALACACPCASASASACVSAGFAAGFAASAVFVCVFLPSLVLLGCARASCLRFRVCRCLLAFEFVPLCCAQLQSKRLQASLTHHAWLTNICSPLALGELRSLPSKTNLIPSSGWELPGPEHAFVQHVFVLPFPPAVCKTRASSVCNTLARCGREFS